MKLWETFRYELVYQSRSVSTWFYGLLLLVLSYLMATIFIDEPLAEGYFSNAPYIVTKVSLISFFFLGLLILAQFSGHAAARDLESRMHPLLYASPIPRSTYLGGRFLAAFALGSMIMIAIPLGVFAAGIIPLEHPEKLGPIIPGAYLSTYFFLILPNTFFVVAFMFAAAVLSRKGMVSYLITVITGVLVIASWQVIGSQQGNWNVANFTDPLGLTFVQELEKLWNVNQKNSSLPGLQSSILLNRLLWLSLSSGILVTTYLRFNTSTILPKDKKAERKRREAKIFSPGNDQPSHGDEILIPLVSKSFDIKTRLLQLSTILRESFRWIAFGWGWVALVLMFLFVVLTGSMWFSDYYDIPELPVTGNLLATLQNVKEHGIWLVIPLLIIYYAGELVWRERDARLNDMLGAAPLPVWVSFAGKFAGMFLALVVMQFCLMTAGILLQVSLGYYDFQIPVYLKILLGLRLVDYVLLAVMAFALHVILNQKYLAHLIAVLFYLLPIFGPEFGIESGLLLYGSDPGWSWSDLRELNPYLGPWLYFKLYWAAWAMFLVAATTLLWPRGTEKGFMRRFRQGVERENVTTKALAGISMLLIVILAGFIHYSTHYLFTETATVGTTEWKAEYEKRYHRYSKRPQPSATKVKLQIEIYPEEGSAEFRGSYVLINKTKAEIDTLFISTSPGVEHHTLSWNQPVKSQQVDEELDFRMYTLQEPILPGDSIQLDFYIKYNPKGFPHNGMNTLVVKNGIYFEDAWLPVMGYNTSRQVFDANDRKEQGLSPRSFLESDDEAYAQQRVQFDVTIGTDKDHIAVAPGKLLKTWTEKDRSYFHYATENPVNHKSAFFSSDYDLYKTQWRSDSAQVVDIGILHHPKHIHNLTRMASGVQASFNYLTRELGSYPHSQIRFTEVPGYNKGLHAYPTNIFYREGFALLKPEEDTRRIDIVFATVAHEVAHQWWGHQVSPAPIKGAALITESLAWFAAFEIVEEAQGQKIFHALLDLARDDYFSPQERSADPLLQANQTSLIYRKGPLALYALREYIGKEPMRQALQKFFRKYSKVDGERPVPSDLYKELQNATPDSLKYLLHDLFATNTFWELKTEKVVATETDSGKWKVTLDVVTRKFTVDQLGNETDVEMNDWIHIGLFSEVEQTENQAPLYLQQHRLKSGKQTLEIELSQKPKAAGIDPDFLLMDLTRWNNVIHVDGQN